MSHRGSHCFVGILGGMGPLAGATFAARLVQLTPADRDQQHIPALLRNDPRIPDRSSARMAGGADPLPALLEGVGQLAANGVELIAIPCNTAHLWYAQMAAAAPCPVLHIVDAVIDDLRRQGIRHGPVGLLGTRATLRLDLYQSRLRAAGYDCVLPSDDEAERGSIAAIEAVKANDLAGALAPAVQAVQGLRQRGAQAVVLGCTELPLALPHAMRPGLGIAVTDSIDALALAVIDRYRQRPPQDAESAAGAAETALPP